MNTHKVVLGVSPNMKGNELFGGGLTAFLVYASGAAAPVWLRGSHTCSFMMPDSSLSMLR